MNMTKRITRGLALAAGLAVLATAGTATAQYSINFDPAGGPAILSDGENSNKVKILRVPDGTLFAVYGEEMDVSINGNGLVWDAKKGKTRKPFDIMIKHSIDNGATWSAPMNISNTAHLSSSKGIIEQAGPPYKDPVSGHPILEMDPNAVDYPGDSEKPNVFSVGNRLLVTWVDKYCDPNEQRFVVYPELFGVTIPFSCTYASRLEWDSINKTYKPNPLNWGGVFRTDRLSSGIRDAKQDANRGNPTAFAINWQEDPLGLKLGSAEGPGDGASGANVNNGTDIWYSYLPISNFTGAPWSKPARITRNVTGRSALTGREIGTHPEGSYDHGNVGASRPNIGQIGNQVIIAYEETKGSQGWDSGKIIRYHHFAYDAPPPGGEPGIIISDPRENSRRVRFITQDMSNEVPLLFIYKQGKYSQGGPSDIMLRRAVGGITAAHLDPPIDVENARASVVDGTNPLTLVNYDRHLPGINFSGTSAPGQPTGSAPYAATGDNYLENALAHRGVMRGSSILIGYSYVPDLYRFSYLNDQAPYNFFVRRSNDAGRTWSTPVNLSTKVTAASGYTVREPRVVGTPASGPNCALGDVTDCQDPNVIYVAYGLQENVYSQMEEAADVDIYMLVSMDNGVSWSEPKAITAGDALGWMTDEVEDFETQIRVRPDGKETFTVWSGNDGEAVNVMFRRGTVVENTYTAPASSKPPKKK